MAWVCLLYILEMGEILKGGGGAAKVIKRRKSLKVRGVRLFLGFMTFSW